MSFQLNPLPPLDDPARREREALCEQARHEWESRDSVARTMLLLFLGTIGLALLRKLMGW